MISILTCGYKPENKINLENSIKNTIEAEHEFIYHDNRSNPIGICQAYNLLAKQAKGDYLCFVHEDIAFLEIGWGNNLIKNLKQCDVFGVAGGKYKCSTPSGWSISGYNCLKFTQAYPKKASQLFLEEGFHNDVLEEVIILDGVFIAIKKEVFESIQFDEITFKGFHGYDYDFCLNARHKFKLCVAKNIPIIHFSEGRNDKLWFETQILISNKWKDKLPAFIDDLKNIDHEKVKFLAYKQCIYKMVTFRFINLGILIKHFRINLLYYTWLYVFNRKRFNQIP